MLVVDDKKLTLTQNIVIASIDIKRFWYYHKDVLQDFVDDKKYPDYQEGYKKALAYELCDSDVVEILERVKELYEDDLLNVQGRFATISDSEILDEAVAAWCDCKFELGGTALCD